MSDQQEKHARFKALHAREGAFVIPNPWDAGSARILENLGFEALATTSSGFAVSKAMPDSFAVLTREAVLENAAEIVAATSLPVSADLGNGFGDAPEACAETIRAAAGVGLVGGSIEDASGNPDAPIYEFSEAVERVAAAVEAARGLSFTLTARAEGFLHGRDDLDDIIRRLQAFAEAGADVVYAPALPDLDAIRAVCAAVDRPVNVVMGLRGPVWTVEELAAAGVRRISVGGSFARAAIGGLLAAAREVREKGSFNYAHAIPPGSEVAALIKPQG